MFNVERMNELTIMKTTLRYLLIAIAILGVLSVNAQTHQYGATHTTSHEQATYTVQVNPQMPAATMDYRHSNYMTSGSTLPQAAIEGPTTTYDEGGTGKHGHIRRGLDPEDEGEGGETPKPGQAFPIGDAALPLALLACAYLIIRVRRAKGDRTA